MNKMKLDLTPTKQAQLWQMVKNAEEKLSDEETDQLCELLCSFADVFADDSEDLGCTDIAQHCIHTGDAQPVHQAPQCMTRGNSAEHAPARHHPAIKQPMVLTYQRLQ